MEEREESSETSEDSVEIPVNVVDDEEEADQGAEASDSREPSREDEAAGSEESSASSGGPDHTGQQDDGEDESQGDDEPVDGDAEASDELFVDADDGDVEVLDSDADGPGAGDDDGPSEARQRIEELEERIEELREERDHFEDRMMRVAADLENFKKRAKRNEEELKKYGSKPLVSDLLPTIDNLERALEHAKSSEEANIIDGVEMVVRQLHQQLAKHGVESFDATGETFDPERHEAIQQVETSEHDSGEVIEQFQRGYMIHDRLLRPAMVSVAKQVEESDEEAEQASSEDAGEDADTEETSAE